jgi:hypothetical protein
MAGQFHDYLLEQHLQLGKAGKFMGNSTIPYASFSGSLLSAYGAKYVLDFGSGVGLGDSKEHAGHQFIRQKASLPLSIMGYEPTSDNTDRSPGLNRLVPSNDNAFDAAISFDVIEHLDYHDAALIVPELFRVSKDLVITNISCIPAAKKLPNGRNAHTSLLPPMAWVMMFWQESLKADKSFALFMTVSNDEDSFVHNIPVERHKSSFHDQVFDIAAGDRNIVTHPRRKKTINGLDLSQAMDPSTRWLKSHVSSILSYY